MNQYEHLMSNATNKKDITILKEIEQLLSITLPSLPIVIMGKIGYKITNNRITELSLQGIDSQSVIDKIFSLENLEKLILNDSKISFIPDSIKNLKNLKVLFLKGNSLEFVPQNILDLPNLRSLDFSNNKLTSLRIKEDQFTLLKVLELDNNMLEEIIFEDNSCFLLEELYVNRNKLAGLNIDHLINLKYLCAQNNHLQAFPKVNNFEQLTILELDYNNMNDFSIDVNTLPNLENLSISYNKITKINFSNKKLQKLPHFFYDGNPIDKKSIKKLHNFAKTNSSSFFYS